MQESMDPDSEQDVVADAEDADKKLADEASTNESDKKDAAATDEASPAEDVSDETPPAEPDGANEDEDEDSLGTLSEIEDEGPCKRRIKACVPVTTITRRLEKNYSELTTTVQLPGFRRGRVPRRLLEKRFGEDMNKDLQESLMTESFAEIIKENKLKLFGSPRFEEVSYAPDKDFTYEADVEVFPEFKLPKYKGVEVDIAPQTIEDAAVEEQLEKIRSDRAKLEPLDAEQAGPDDVFLGRYELWDGEVKVKTQANVSFRPSLGRLEAFEVEDLSARVEGWNREETRTLSLTVTVPPAYPDEVLRGKDVELRFSLESANSVMLPDLDDEFAKACGEETLEAMRDRIRKDLESRGKREHDRKVEEAILTEVVAKAEIDLPEDFITRYRERQNAEEAGDDDSENEDTAEDDAPVAAADGDDVSDADDTKESAEAIRKELKEFFVLSGIGDKEKIFATEDEVRSRVALIAAIHGMPADTLKEELSSSGRLEEIRFSLRNEKVKAFLRKKAKISGSEEAPEEEKEAADAKPESASEEASE